MSIFQMILIFQLVFMIAAPVLLTVLSKRASGAEKLGWSILAFFLSWIGFAIFMIVTSSRTAQSQSAGETA